MPALQEFQPFVLTPIDHTACPNAYVFYHLLFSLPEPHTSLCDIQAGVESLMRNIPFLAGEVGYSTTTFRGQRALEVRPSSALVKIIPLVQIKHFPKLILPTDNRSQCSTEGLTEVVIDESLWPPQIQISLPLPRPVVRFQANILADGIILTMAFDHTVFDGTGAGVILERLAECCQNPHVNLTPVDNCEAELRSTISRLGKASCATHEFNRLFASSEVPTSTDSQPVSGTPLPQTTTRALTFSPDRIQTLKSACISLLPSLIDAEADHPTSLFFHSTFLPKYLSSSDIVTALVALGIGRARGCVDRLSTPSKLMTAVNFRERLRPPLPKNYFGNAVTVIQTQVSSQGPQIELAKGFSAGEGFLDRNVARVACIAQLAAQLRSGLMSIDDGYVRSLVSYVSQNYGGGGSQIALTDTIVTSWRHLGVYNLDFGVKLGRIARFLPHPPSFDGVCCLLPARALERLTNGAITNASNAPWDIQISLESSTMASFAQDDFTRWACANALESLKDSKRGNIVC